MKRRSNVMGVMMIDLTGMEDILREFLVESYENLDRLDQEFVSLEDNPGDLEVLGSIFRTIHTIKGTSGFFGFSKLEKVTHVGENLLSQLRDGSRQLTPEITTTLLKMVDAVREILRSIESTQSEGDTDYSGLVEVLSALVEGRGASSAEDVPAVEAPVEAPEASNTVAFEAQEELEVELEAEEEPPAPPAPPMGKVLVDSGLANEEQIEDALREQAEGDPRHIGEILVEKGGVPSGQVKEALKKQQSSGKPDSSVADSTLRVDVVQLDRLMNLAGELVLVRNQLLQYATRIEDTAFNPILQRLNLITTELQEGVMKTRMQPIGNVWNKFPRVVRDLAHACSKQVRLDMVGKDTELDKTLLEAIKDPLTHIIRNSVDHGVESPADRIAAGKPAEGVIHMRAYHEGGQVNIEIQDDGAGICASAVKQKAIERGLITPEAAERMSDRDLVNLIFMPGFSTAKQVTNVSGRGVGMDVVKTNITRIGGVVDMTSVEGEGTTLKIKIPLTLAIIPALVVKAGEDRFAVPQVSLLELVRLEGEQAKNGIEMLHGAPVYRLRGKLLPLVHLREQLGFAPIEDSQIINIAVLQAGDRSFGLVVDEITDTEEIVVKPLGSQLKQIRIFSGATIMGDGSVALILDVLGLAQQSRVISVDREQAMADKERHEEDRDKDRQTLLLFRVGGSRMAMPLSEVDRLEEVEAGRIERAGEQEVIQYRGQILPLIRPERHLEERRSVPRSEGDEQRQDVQVVVYSHNGGSFGLVVDAIEDIADESVTVKREATREGVLGVIVVQDKITEMLDVHRLASKVS
jgi:two-component system chemotaxis sensor kinase CheA